MPAVRRATRKAKSGAGKPAKAPRPQTKPRETISRRALQELSDRIDRDLALLVAETERLAAQVIQR